MTRIKSAAFIFLLGIMSLAALALAGCGDGDDDSVESDFRTAHDAITTMIDRAEQGEVDEAEAAFDSVHGALHRVEAEVRSFDNAQADEFSGQVIAVEEELAGERDASRLAELARETLSQIEQAAETAGVGPLSE